MRLKQFNPNKELKKLDRKYTKKHLIISLIVLVLLISIGSSYAIFSIQTEYHTLIKGTVGEFSTGDILLSVLVEGEKQDNFPAKGSGYTFESVTCEKGTTGTWDTTNWGLKITFIKPDKCTVNFAKGLVFSTEGTSEFTSVKLNGVEIIIGQTYVYKAGDKLQIQKSEAASSGSKMTIYNSSNEHLKEISAFACAFQPTFTEEYIFSGQEALIVFSTNNGDDDTQICP